MFAVRAFDAAVSELAARAHPPSRRSRRTPPRPTPGSSCRCCSAPLALWVAFGAIGGRLFGRRRIQVPKKVAASGVPLRTPSPEPRRPAPPARGQAGVSAEEIDEDSRRPALAPRAWGDPIAGGRRSSIRVIFFQTISSGFEPTDFRVVEVASTVAIRRALADRRDARRRAKKSATTQRARAER